MVYLAHAPESVFLGVQVMVFFSSCNSVKYHAELLNYIDIPVTDIHGKQKQQRRTTAYFEFCQAEKGILLCTDVAARGLDIPAVDWIIQYDPPDDPKEYIHRVGRTARGKSGKGRALLMLLPEELGFLSFLKVTFITYQSLFMFPVMHRPFCSAMVMLLVDCVCVCACCTSQLPVLGYKAWLLRVQSD